MSWFLPPPASAKPLHPLRGLVKPPRMLAHYITGIILWTIVIHFFWFAFLLIRVLITNYQLRITNYFFSSFFPSWFWNIEFIVLLLGLTLGSWTTTLILIQLSERKAPSSTD